MNQEIIHYYVEISDGSGVIGAANKFETTAHMVIAENHVNMVIDDLFFTTIAKDKCAYREYLDKESVHVTVGDTVWGNRVTYSLYTKKKKRAASIKKTIEQAILKKVGFFMRGIDLSVIRDAKSEGRAA
jgi:hypothetical protein